MMSGTLIMRGVEKAVTFPFTITDEITDPWGNKKRGFSAELSEEGRGVDDPPHRALRGEV